MVSFAKLWENHPTGDFPCKDTGGNRAYENQCAIRMGVTFDESGVGTKSFNGARCWHSHMPSHILRAEELAIWLKGPFSPFKKLRFLRRRTALAASQEGQGCYFLRTIMGKTAKAIILICGTAADFPGSCPGLSLFSEAAGTMKKPQSGFGL